MNDSRSIDEILASITGGRESHPEIFEALKSVAKSQPAPAAGDDLLVEEPKSVSTPEPASRVEPTHEQFICPVCESPVDASATACPSCGAQFAEGEASEFECPVCRSSVAANADACSNCGVRFAEEHEEAAPEVARQPAPPEVRSPPSGPGPPLAPPRSLLPGPTVSVALRERLSSVRAGKRQAQIPAPSGDRKLMYRELPRLVNDVKGLLVAAKQIGLEIDVQKRLINEAIAAGKQRDIERAVRMINEAKHALDVAFTDFIGSRIDAFLLELGRAPPGTETAPVEKMLQEAVSRLEAGNYDGAWDQLEAATKGFQSTAREYIEAKDVLDEDERLLTEARGLGMNVRDLEGLIRQGREAIARRDQAGAQKSAKTTRDRLRKEIPAFVQEEMREARNRLLDLKMRGGDLSKPIGILKAASVHAKREEWREAMRYLKEFRKEIDSL